MRNFTTEDFEGAGQYLVACRNTEPNRFTNTGFLSTIMYKIGYAHSSPELPENVRKKSGSNNYSIVSMSDGWTINGYFITKDKNGDKIEDSSKWKWVAFRGKDNQEAKQKLVDYLNNPDLSEEYRFATQEEVVRVVLYQKSRWK